MNDGVNRRTRGKKNACACTKLLCWFRFAAGGREWYNHYWGMTRMNVTGAKTENFTVPNEKLEINQRLEERKKTNNHWMTKTTSRVNGVRANNINPWIPIASLNEKILNNHDRIERINVEHIEKKGNEYAHSQTQLVIQSEVFFSTIRSHPFPISLSLCGRGVKEVNVDHDATRQSPFSLSFVLFVIVARERERIKSLPRN